MRHKTSTTYTPQLENDQSQQRLAVLIDADNAPAAIIEGLFEEIAKYGIASVKRIYGDWTKPHLSGWKKTLLDYSIQPIQQFAYTSGKNATDSALIIDAMDLLYTDRFDGFCLVSSDSDFTRLAARLREAGMTVYGFGEVKTPSPFVSACDKFIYTEILRPTDESNRQKTDVDTEDTAKQSDNATESKSAPVALITKVIEDISDTDGWVQLGAVGQNINKLRPDFDARLYGFKKLSELIKANGDCFEVQEREISDTGGKSLYVCIRR